MGLTPLVDAVRQQYNIPATVHGGLVVTRVASDSDAAHVGIKPGYVIQRAGDRVVNTPADMTAAVAEARHEGRPSILLLVNMSGRTGFVPVKLDSADTQK